MLSFVFQSACDCGDDDCNCDEKIAEMDCNEYCEQIACLAERVAAGENIDQILPQFGHHLKYWRDCREEFEALVAVIKAERSGSTQDTQDNDSAQ